MWDDVDLVPGGRTRTDGRTGKHEIRQLALLVVVAVLAAGLLLFA